MAFFDELGKKVSQAGQAAVEKTKEMAAVSKINSSISDEERKINNNYLEIGKLYFATHEANAEPDFAAMVAAIRESNDKIAEYRKQIMEVKGVVICEKCGAEIAGGAAFCASCGAPAPAKAETSAEETVQASADEAEPAVEPADAPAEDA